MFTINVPSGAVITVTSLGYRSQSLNVGTRDNIRILLEPDSEVLEDVVVTAFGVGQKKESVVGAVQLVRPESLIVPSANLSTAFAGRLAGVVSFQRSGMPGQNGSDFYIRGISTISGVTSPLIILDGVEISAGDLNAIDPEIIEGFSILKDATATAMYGTRGANGVMIITTKSGRDLDRPIIGFRIETNVTTPTRLPKFVDGARYMELFNEAVTNQGTGDVLFSKERIDGTRKRLNPYVYPDVNWYDEIFRNHAFNQKVNFNIRGGTGKITYFMNLTVNHETGMLRDRSKDFFSFSNGINVMKYAFQNNIDFHMSKSSTISLHLNAQVNDITAPAINNNDTSPAGQMNRIYSSIMDCNPVDFPVYFPAGEEKWIKWGAFSGGNDQGATNPLAQATRIILKAEHLGNERPGAERGSHRQSDRREHRHVLPHGVERGNPGAALAPDPASGGLDRGTLEILVRSEKQRTAETDEELRHPCQHRRLETGHCVKKFTKDEDGLPVTATDAYTSPNLPVTQPFDHIRMVVNAVNSGEVFFTMSEFRLWQVKVVDPEAE